jgi:hypothetical protein
LGDRDTLGDRAALRLCSAACRIAIGGTRIVVDRRVPAIGCGSSARATGAARPVSPGATLEWRERR